MNQTKNHLQRLRSSGLRPTRQRLIICKTLFDRKETFHFTIEKLKTILESSNSARISLATIYNTVHAFKNHGYLKEISLQGNKSFFDTNATSHHHFYDTATNNLSDIKSEEISLKKIPNAPKGKKIKEIELKIIVANNNQTQKK